MQTNLFKNIDDQITELEKEKEIPMLITLLSRTSQANKFTGKQICEWFTLQGLPLSQLRLCLLVHYIRIHNLVSPCVLIGAKRGYFKTDNHKFIEDQIQSLSGRVDSLNNVIDALRAQLLSIKKTIPNDKRAS